MTKESAANWRNLESKREHSIRRDEAKKKELIKATENSRKSYDEFDGSDGVVFIVYGVRDGEQISKEEYPVDFSTKNTEIQLDITEADELYIYKDGDYSQAKIAGQYINGYTGMGVLMRNAVLHK